MGKRCWSIHQAIDAETVLADHEQTEPPYQRLARCAGHAHGARASYSGGKAAGGMPGYAGPTRLPSFQISSERVRQIEIRAFAKVRRAAILAAQDAARKRADGASGSRSRELTAP